MFTIFLRFGADVSGTRVGILLIWNAKPRQNQLLSAQGTNSNVPAVHLHEV